jgi:membrane dipeptidase
MMVDISHVADKTFFHAIAATQAPVIASHASARALANHPRNMTDDMLRAVAKNGGVVQANSIPPLLTKTIGKLPTSNSRKPTRRSQYTSQN